ncbi:UDP-N-acetylglucosamine transferase subunit ALG13 homolog [Mya arenaria]|uniref:UDP-N-acetylglucosamine transferase subunit ALG13 homolog n=1 Tax=Mya arenaria TaxID=6604 RepID=UPI0022E1E846|nr:UDP-N-acetylglucosamine transferase subunit ALG13 homolog [Mya arenaria]XP_052815851.1 UDP-N-acetylglucosamine transferase subunit ALG13 homolog [Mya arenaria]XP_052815925.1 UDP-N-acetylglucosamine transferase subunit ALG13 homolog [Mya arenaria]
METRKRKGTKRVFVTVGTTQFDKLIETMCSEDTLKALQMLGYSNLLLQRGCGQYDPPSTTGDGMFVDHYRYKSNIREDIEQADLVISHAGAGSCLETLGAGRKLLVVINEGLMDNHQLELANQLHLDGHLHYCTCSTLVQTLRTKNFTNLKPFPPGKPEVFAQYLDNLMGFT